MKTELKTAVIFSTLVLVLNMHIEASIIDKATCSNNLEFFTLETIGNKCLGSPDTLLQPDAQKSSRYEIAEEDGRQRRDQDDDQLTGYTGGMDRDDREEEMDHMRRDHGDSQPTGYSDGMHRDDREQEIERMRRDNGDDQPTGHTGGMHRDDNEDQPDSIRRNTDR